MTPVRLCTSMESNCTSDLQLVGLVEAWQIHLARSKFVQKGVFDLIIDAFRHHFRSFLEAEPEVQAKVALYQTTRTPTGTFVEFTSRIINRIREMENSLKECLPPKMRGFIIKRQAKLTPDQAKHFHFDMPARRLEADRMVEAFNRFDQTDALVEQVLCDRVKLEQRSNRVHAHTSHFCAATTIEFCDHRRSRTNRLPDPFCWNGI